MKTVSFGAQLAPTLHVGVRTLVIRVTSRIVERAGKCISSAYFSMRDVHANRNAARLARFGDLDSERGERHERHEIV